MSVHHKCGLYPNVGNNPGGAGVEKHCAACLMAGREGDGHRRNECPYLKMDQEMEEWVKPGKPRSKETAKEAAEKEARRMAKADAEAERLKRRNKSRLKLESLREEKEQFESELRGLEEVKARVKSAKKEAGLEEAQEGLKSAKKEAKSAKKETGKEQIQQSPREAFKLKEEQRTRIREMQEVEEQKKRKRRKLTKLSELEQAGWRPDEDAAEEQEQVVVKVEKEEVSEDELEDEFPPLSSSEEERKPAVKREVSKAEQEMEEQKKEEQEKEQPSQLSPSQRSLRSAGSALPGLDHNGVEETLEERRVRLQEWNKVLAAVKGELGTWLSKLSSSLV